MFKLLNNISIRARLSISVCLFIFSLAASLWVSWMKVEADIHFAEQERHGAEYQLPLIKMMHDTAVIRRLTAEGKTEGLDAHIAAVGKDLEELRRLHNNLKDELKLVPDELAARGKSHLDLDVVSKKWEKLSSDLRAGNSGQADVASFIGDVKGLITHVGDMSNLILDPDLDTYYMMDAFMLALPGSLEKLSLIAATTYPNLSSPNPPAPATSVSYAVNAELLSVSDVDRVAADIDIAFKEDANFYIVNPDLKPTVEPLLADYVKKNKALSVAPSDLSLMKPVLPADFDAAWTQALESAYALNIAVLSQIETMFDERLEAFRDNRLKSMSISVCMVIVAIVFFGFVAQTLIGPLARLTSTMTDIAEGKLSVDVPYREVTSEIGKMAVALEVFKKNAQANKRLEEEKVETEKRAKKEKKEAMDDLANSFQAKVQGIISSVASASTELSHTADLMNKSISQSNKNAQDAVKSSVETSQNVQTVAAAAEEMSATIQEISSQTQKANALISESVDKVKGADSYAVELQQASTEVRNVIKLISNISSQINLLALNATIESARAGEAGKGFAVVANEVRNLAGQTDRSIQDIEKVITDMSRASEGVIAALSGIKESVDKIYVASCGVASAVEEQSAVVSDIAQNMTTATHKTGVVKENIQRVSTLSGEAEESSRQVLQASQELSRQAETLDNHVGQFLNEVRSS